VKRNGKYGRNPSWIVKRWKKCKLNSEKIWEICKNIPFFSLFDLLFSIISIFFHYSTWDFFHIYHIFSLFNLYLLHKFHILVE
jgi:hypothetical protein